MEFIPPATQKLNKEQLLYLIVHSLVNTIDPVFLQDMIVIDFEK